MNKLLPRTIQAGATLDKLVPLAAYPAPDWVLNVHLRGPSVINLAAVPSGAAHQLLKAAADTSDFTAGTYLYVARVSRDGVVEQVDDGQVEVLADLTKLDAATDLRTHAQKVLDAIEAVLEKRATLDQERYRINDRELYRTPLSELRALRAQYRAEVRQERAKARGRSLWGPAVRVRF